MSEESLEKLTRLGIKVDAPKPSMGTGLQYRDMKFIGGGIKLGGRGKNSNIAPEIQFVLDNNKNEA